MASRFTPGPWVLRPQGSEIEVKHGIYTIGMVHNYNSPQEANEANARLIAAAPELLEALQDALAWIDAVPKDIQLPTMPGFDRDNVDGIIHKALGK